MLRSVDQLMATPLPHALLAALVFSASFGGCGSSASMVTETISPADTTQYFISGGAIAADGRAFALFAPADNNSLYLGTRAAAGGWTRDVVSTTHSGLAQGWRWDRPVRSTSPTRSSAGDRRS